ncbi:thioredoxin-like protein [Rhizopogon vinicolor AM-OR11-026]|uniref:Thioredoxin-like protein n=1 Tax=Rhizopogon vinicolor AM-OR11-026 TaxID=1314800 RepID=A0A1B7NE18_9AGAM|nr:thioredoxin-like protein [Rhizopogon vinicolor AM-OR11-026]
MSDPDSTPSPEPQRTIKIIFISDYICSFCYIGNKSLRDAITGCHDLNVRFDVEFRPFALLCQSSQAEQAKANGGKLPNRREYLARKFGKEQAEAKWKAVEELAQKAGLRLAEDGIVARSILAHRLAVKAYQVGGQEMQGKLNDIIFEAVFADCKDISDIEFLAEAAEKVGLMDKTEATAFLQDTDCKGCVDKMIDAARASGVSGVPSIIIDGKWALNGVQSTECYLQILRKIAQAPSTPNAACSAACMTEGTPIIPVHS